MLGAAVLFIIAVRIGYYQPGVTRPDAGIRLGYLVLGSAAWVGNAPAEGRQVASAAAVRWPPEA